MKKTLIASAIAVATFTSGAMAADRNLPELYGNVQLVWAHQQTKATGGDSTATQLMDNGSTLGVKHSHEIVPGITAFAKIDMEFSGDDKSTSGGLNTLDEAYIGIEGKQFGKVWVGSDDSVYETAIDEVSNHFEFGAQSKRGPYDTGEGDLVQYSSPAFSGLKLHAAVQVNGDGDKAGKSSKPYQLAATYEMPGVELAVGMDSNDGDLAYSKTTAGVSNKNTYGLRLSSNLGAIRITTQYQTREDEAELYSMLGKYSMGKNTFALAYEVQNGDSKGSKKGTDVNGKAADRNTQVITAQAVHNVSDNLYVYVEGQLADTDTSGADGRDLAVGTAYSF